MACDFCADVTVTYTELDQLAIDFEQHSFLLRCPECGRLFDMAPEEKRPAEELSEAEARRRYPGAL
jgi:uncharacterized Zn finger protein